MPPIEIDKILSDPLLIVAATLLVVSPIVFLVAFVKYLRTPKSDAFAIPRHEMESPIMSRPGVPDFSAPAPEPLADMAPQPETAPILETEPAASGPISSLEPLPAAGTSAVEPPQPAFPTPPARRPDTASEKTVVMPPGMAEMQSEMEIAFSQLKLLNKRVASLEKELSQLRSGGSSEPGGNPQP